jgi:hypothetical protein
MDYPACDVCVLALEPCHAKAEGFGVLCAHARKETAALARGERPDTDYRGLIRVRSDPSYVPPPAPAPGPEPAPTSLPTILPACPDRGPVTDASDCPACQTYLCRKFVRVVSGAECTRCEAAGFTYSG